MTTTASRPQAPAPTGPAWEMFTAQHPEIADTAIALRWQKGEEIYAAGLVGSPDSHGARQVRSQNGVDLYTVAIASLRPRTYFCTCPDFANRNPFGGFCKHAISCYIACSTAYQQQQEARRAAAALEELARSNPAGMIALALAIQSRDGKAARTAAARLAGWPPRKAKGKEVAA